MKLKTLLVSAVALLCSAASWGITAPTASTPSVGKSYYLYNPETEKFLAVNNNIPYVLNNGLEWLLEDAGDSKIKIRLKNRTEGYFWGMYWANFAGSYSTYNSETLFILTDLGSSTYKLRTDRWNQESPAVESYVYINTENENRVACNSHAEPKFSVELQKWQFISEIDYIKYQIQNNASVDLTCRIVNPSFEHGTNPFNGWTNSAMTSQSNTAFAKTGNNYAEAYEPNGTKSVSQTLSGLPAGYYTLSAKCLARGVTSAKIFANSYETPITIEDASNDYSVEFTCDGSTDFNIGFEGTGTGISYSWIAADNFTLSYTPYISEIADDYPSGGTVAANKWYKVFIPTAGNYDVTSTNAATIYYSQDGTTAVNEGTSLSFAAAEKKSLSLSVGYLYIRSSAAQTLNVDTRFYLATTVNAETKWLNKNADGYTYAYDKGLPFTLESNNGNVVLKFSDGNYLNDVGSNWQTKAEGSKNNDWKLSTVDGGYKLLLGVNNDCQLFIANTGTGLVEITHSSNDGNVWRFVQPEDALASAIATAEAHTLGFEDGEYAPYNNTTPIAALATAKAATTNDARISAYTALTDATWTANVGEVNAFYDGTFSTREAQETSKDGTKIPGWTSGNNIRQILKTVATFPGLEDATDKTALFVWSGGASYGSDEGYTMPLKANSIYKLGVKVAGWNNETRGNITVSVKNSEDGMAATVIGKAAKDISVSMTSFEILFATGAAGNYVFTMSSTNNIVFSDIELKKAASQALTFKEDGSTPTFAAGTYPSVALDRTFNPKNYSTLCLPFAMTEEQTSAAFSEAYEFNAVVGNSLKFVSASSIATGKPYLVKAKGADLSVSGVALDPTAVVDDVTHDGVTFKGIFSSIDALPTDGTCYVVSSNNLYQVNSPVGMDAYRAYFQADGGSTKSFVLNFDDADAISDVRSKMEDGKNEIYNLAGQRLSKAQKGVNIINGKKVLVK